MTSGIITSGANGTAYFYQKTWSGTNTVNHTKAKPMPWNSYDMMMTQQVCVRGKTQYQSGYANYQGPNPWTSNDELALLGKLSEKAKGHEFNLAVSAAEGPQSVKLVLNTLVRLSSATRALKKGRLDLALRALGAPPKKGRAVYDTRTLNHKDISAMWLEIQYGWRPLIQDVYASFAAYAAIANAPRVTRFSVSHRAEGKNRAGIPNGGYNSGWIDQTSVHSKRLICEIKELPSVARSLGLLNPAAVVWEKTPFSFVADWFIPIGTYLDALNIIPAISGRYLVSYKREVNTVVTGITFFNASNFVWVTAFEGAKNHAREVKFTRSIVSSYPVPFPTFKPLEKSLSPGHVKNAIALLHQIVTTH